MNRETYLWVGIIGQGVPILTGLYLVTVGNWMIKRRKRKSMKKQNEIKYPYWIGGVKIYGQSPSAIKPKTVKHNLWTNAKEIIDEFKTDKIGY